MKKSNINIEIEQCKVQYKVDRQTAKISALSSVNFGEYKS